MQYGPDYYREVAPPIIIHRVVDFTKSDCPRRHSEQHAGRSFYTVEYPYDKKEESFNWDFSAKVYIWGDTGIAFSIKSGTGMGFFGIDKKKEGVDERERIMRYTKQPPRK